MTEEIVTTGWVTIGKDGKPTTTSLKIAEVFGKRHDNVLRDISDLKCSNDFRLLNFEVTQQIVLVGAVKRKIEYYEMTRDGFYFLVFGYTGELAARFKEEYIKEFNRMETEKYGRPTPVPPGLPNFNDPADAAEAWAHERRCRMTAETMLVEAKKRVIEIGEIKDLIKTKILPQLKEASLNVVSFDRFLECKEPITLAHMANLYTSYHADDLNDLAVDAGLERFVVEKKDLCRYLRKVNIIISGSRNPPNQKYIDAGWFVVNCTAKGLPQTLVLSTGIKSILEIPPRALLNSRLSRIIAEKNYEIFIGKIKKALVK